MRLRPRGHRLQRGLTLVEWMVAITLGAFLVVALLQLLAQQSLTQTELTRSSRQIENGRYAVQLLTEDLQLAGYYGELGSTSGISVPASLPNPCSKSELDMAAAMPVHVQGYDGDLLVPNLPAGFAADCLLDAANHLDGTDILVVRRSATTAQTVLTVGRQYLQTGLVAGGTALSSVLKPAAATAVTTSATFPLLTRTGSAAPIRAFLVQIYFVSPCNVPKTGSTCSSDGTDDGGVSIPTLKRLELNALGSAWTVVPLVEGIENLQVEYGVDSNLDGVPNGAYSAAGSIAPTDWPNVMSVRVHLLARNLEKSAGHVDSSSYALGAVTVDASNDAYKRRVFSQTIRLVNPSGRRDS